ncbi:MAG TPA: NAD(P)/FAD-dependent oxidoreductase [Jiangellaceae bacterium]|nr:NAD(P)/FAD-dependent oxidoreductase [Jiangellaceae bacterium]
MPTDTFDVVVIGAGPPGQNVAEQVVRGGLSCALVEHELVGGECSYWACMPSKAMLRPWAAWSAAQAVPGSQAAEEDGVDAKRVMNSRDAFASRWRDDSQVEWVEDVGAVLFRGHGRLAGERRVDVASRQGELAELTARHAVVISTGSRAAIPEIPGLAAANPWTNRGGTAADQVPESLAVIGGGAVGTELATAWASLGSTVTLLARGERLLSRMEPFAGDLVAAALRDMGVDVRTGTSVESVSRDDATGPVTLRTSGGEEIVAAEVLVGAGRAPRTDEVGVDSVGLTPGDWLAVDPTARVKGVTGDWLYAVGDVNGRSLLTHQGKYQARQAGAAIVARASGQAVDESPWGRYAATADEVAASQVVFTHPAVAFVGRTAEQARRAGMNVDVVDYDLAKVAGAALHAKGYEGQARMVVDRERQVIVGATVVGPDVAEMIHAATVAVVGEVPLERLWHAVPAFPTVSEVWLRLLETYSADGQ